MNIYDVAKEAGVSIATVSRVINNNGSVNPKTKEKIEEVIKKLGYVPNAIARGLATNSTKTIGVLVPDIRNTFHAESAFALEQDLYKNGYSSILCNTTESLKQKIDYLYLMEMKKVDAIFLVGAAYGEDELISEIKKINEKVPVVMLNNSIEGILSIHCDSTYGIKSSIKYLKDKGYKHPMYVSHKKVFDTRAYTTKLEGFYQGMDLYFPNIDKNIIESKDDEKSNKYIVNYIKKNKFIDAIQFEKDTMAVKFMKLAISEGLDIPNDVAIIGFDNIDVTEFTQKKISTIDHKIKEHCDLAVKLLMDILKGKDTKLDNRIIPEFIEKETT